MHLRPARPEDAAAWVRVVLAASPLFAVDAASETHEMATEPTGVRRLVAEVDGEVVAVARYRPAPAEQHVALLVMVHPDHRRTGIGTALMGRMVDLWHDSGLPRAISVVEDDPASRAARERWGFHHVRDLRTAMVDPRTVPDPGPPPAGLEVVALEQVGPEPVWRTHQEVARDDPSGLTLPQPYDEWRAGEWADPRARADLGHAVLVDGGLAAYSMLGVAGARGWSMMTGTLPGHRGRGLALLAKQHTLRAAARAGVTQAVTGNDGANLPMLAVNRRLGYRAAASPGLAERLR